MNHQSGLSIEKAGEKSVHLFFFFLKCPKILYRRLLTNISLKMYICVYIFLETLSYLQYFPRHIFTLFYFVSMHLNDLIHIPVTRFLIYIRA